MKYQKITKSSKNSQKNNSETVKNEYNKEMPKERYICPEERQKINNEILKYNKFIRQYFKTSM